MLLTALTVLAAPFLSGEAIAAHMRVVVFPLEMHAEGDISSARRNVVEAFASALHAEGAELAGMEEMKRLVLEKGVKDFDEAAAVGLARASGADFAVIGSLTRLGSSYDASWRVIDAATGDPAAFYHSSSPSEREMEKKAADTARAAFSKMTGLLRARPAVRSGIVDRITVAGNRRVDSEAILKKISSREGAHFSTDDVREDIRAVYGTGFFDDITVDLTDTASGKVLTYIVREMPFVRKVEFSGNDELKNERIQEALSVKENTVLNRVLLAENAEKIKEIYAEDGFYLATVNPVVESDGIDAKVVFRIDEGPAVKVRRITIIGARAYSASRLKRLMGTKEAGIFSFVTKSGRFSEFDFENDLAHIMNHYFNNGYIQADILDHRVLLSEDKRWFYITIALNEGEQFRIGKIDARGDIVTSRDDVLEKLKLSSGAVFSRAKLSRGIEAVTDIYGDRGYAYVDVKPVTSLNAAEKTIDLTLDIKKNELVYIERIDISGNTRTRDKVIRRELEVAEGSLFSSSELKRSRNNLRRLGFFEDVRIRQTQGSTGERIKLDVDIKERPTGSISMGFGYSSVDKLIGTASISQTNFMGTGIKLDLSGTVSASSSRYVLGFTEPWLFDKPISAGIDLYNTDRDYPDFKLRKNGFNLRFGFPVGDRYTRGYVTYKLEDVNIKDVADTASTFIKEQEGTSTESAVKFLVRRDTRDDAFFPREGYTLSGSVEFAGGMLGGTNYYVKYEADAIKFIPLPKETSLSLRASAGYVHSYKGHTVPIYERYFLGGMNSIRGFVTRSISPKDPATGDLVGGDTMLVLNAEFLFPLFSDANLKGLVFFDAGNSYEGRIDPGDMRRAVGFGIRWFSPVGPLRIELGFNLDRREDEQPQQWDFAIGTVF